MTVKESGATGANTNVGVRVYRWTLLACLGLLPFGVMARPSIQNEAQYFQTLEQDVAWLNQAEAQLGSQDPRSYFLRVYHAVTLEMPALFEQQQFQNPEWVHRLMLKYVSLYRHALDCHLSQSCEVSPAWQTAFNENQVGRYQPTVQLLISISAHVNRDLPIALAAMDTDFQDASLHADFQKISLIFQRRMADLIRISKEYQRCSVSPTDRWLINRVIRYAMNETREMSWNAGAHLAATKTADEERQVLEEIERHTQKENRSIYLYAPIPGQIVCF